MSTATADEKALLAAMRDAKRQRRPCLIFFHATWCGACEHTKSTILDGIRAACQQRGVALLEADVDRTPQLSSALGVQAMPTFQLMRHDGTTLRKGAAVVGADGEAVQRLVAA